MSDKADSVCGSEFEYVPELESQYSLPSLGELVAASSEPKGGARVRMGACKDSRFWRPLSYSPLTPLRLLSRPPTGRANSQEVCLPTTTANATRLVSSQSRGPPAAAPGTLPPSAWS